MMRVGVKNLGNDVSSFVTDLSAPCKVIGLCTVPPIP